MQKWKRYLALFVAIIISMTVLPGWTAATRADDSIAAASVTSDGILTFDPVPGAVRYVAMLANYGTFEVSESPVDLGALMEKKSYRSGEYSLYFEAVVKQNDGSQEYQSLLSDAKFTYTAKHGVLATPSNIKLDGQKITWDAVPNVETYEIWLTNESGQNFTTTLVNGESTSCGIGVFVDPGFVGKIQINVIALNYSGYQKSEVGHTELFDLDYTFDSLTNVQLHESGILTWDPFPGATKYEISIKSATSGSFVVAYENKCNVYQKVFSLADRFGSDPYKSWTIKIYACDDNGRVSDNTVLTFQLEYKEYDLYILGEQVTTRNLAPSDENTENQCYTFDPGTNTLTLDLVDMTGSYTSLDTIEAFIKSGIDLTINGDFEIDHEAPYPLIESTKKVTFAEDATFVAMSSKYGVHASDIEILGGKVGVYSASDYAFWADNDVIVHNKIELAGGQSGVGRATIFAENGKITLEKGVIIDTPAGGAVSADGHRILMADGSTVATKVLLKSDPNAMKTFAVNVTTDGNGTASASVAEATAGDTVTLTATPNAGYQFKEWQVVSGGVTITNNTFVMGTENVEIKAVFEAIPVTPDPQPVQEPSFAEFIDRLYRYALLREPEPDGKAFWLNKVLNEGFTGGRCAYGFLVEAQEFLNRDLTNEQFIDTLYLIFFDRAPDASGKAFWLQKFAEGMTRPEMVNGFIDSIEWCNLCAYYGVKSGAPNAKAEKPSNNAIKFATRLYTECLGREYDADGLMFWALRLTNLESSGYEAALGFFTSPEFQQKGIGDDEFIHRLYRTFMGRDEDADGFAFWKSHLGVDMTREDLVKGFAQSQEFTNICNQYGIDKGI